MDIDPGKIERGLKAWRRMRGELMARGRLAPWTADDGHCVAGYLDELRAIGEVLCAARGFLPEDDVPATDESLARWEERTGFGAMPATLKLYAMHVATSWGAVAQLRDARGAVAQVS